MSSRARSLANRWLGVGLAACLAVVTIALTVTGRLALYVNPDSAWFVVGMAVVVLIGAAASFLLPLGAEADHGHDHGDPSVADATHEPDHHPGRADDHTHDPASGAQSHAGSAHPVPVRRSATRLAGRTATVAGGAVATGVVVAMLVVPPASLSAELAMSRDVGAPPLFAGADVITLASSGDTSEFGVGDWSSIFASATTPDAFDGDPVTLIGFVTPGEGRGDGFDLTRLVITHCVIDAQTASIPVSTQASLPSTGQWVEISGTVRSTAGGELQVQADEVRAIDEPQDPYEY